MEKKVEVKKIVLKVGNQEIELDMDKARELRDVLNLILGEGKEIITLPPVTIPYPVYPDGWHWIPPERIYPPTTPQPPWIITWGTSITSHVPDTLVLSMS